MPRRRYCRDWPDEASDLTIELQAFRHDFAPEEGGMGKAEHFWRIVEVLWNYEGSPERFERTPEAEKMVAMLCIHDYLGIAGCASCGKSGTLAVWGIVCFLSNPSATKIIMTSTSLKDSKKRIWGSVIRYWNALAIEAPGKLVDSLGAIRYVDLEGRAYDTSGLEIIAGEKKKEKEAIGKLIGFKVGSSENALLIMIVDEMPELSFALVEAAANLSVNPNFQMVGLGNPASYFDPFGDFMKPKHPDGFKSIDEDSEEWETEMGYALRFDAEKMVNVVRDEVVYPWQPTREWIEKQKSRFGENSPTYWRMIRGFWSPTGSEDSIYSEADLLRFASIAAPKWMTPPTTLAFLDPDFVEGGDSSICVFGRLGKSPSGLQVIEGVEHVELHADLSIEDDPRSFQIVRAYKEECESRSVLAKNAGYDSTGGGAPFGDVVRKVWNTGDLLAVGFGGAPSDRIVSEEDPVPAHQRYVNKVTELWMQALPLLRSGQLCGLWPELMTEMTSRLYETRKGSQDSDDDIGIRYEVESKKKMKGRVGKSPNIADGFFGIIELARVRHKLMASEYLQATETHDQSWSKFARSQDVLGQSRNAFLGDDLEDDSFFFDQQIF